MTTKQRIFCEQYLKLEDGTAAAIAAGYSEKSAPTTGARLLAKAEISAYLTQRKSEIEKQNIAGNDEILEYLTKVMRSNDEDVTVRDKMRAAELLGKNASLFSDHTQIPQRPVIFFGEENIAD
ncbi:MAG: terminase small subunit [Bacillota bacterium]|nr:terminase small subunit [Bacillota bacterium]